MSSKIGSLVFVILKRSFVTLYLSDLYLYLISIYVAVINSIYLMTITLTSATISSVMYLVFSRWFYKNTFSFCIFTSGL